MKTVLYFALLALGCGWYGSIPDLYRHSAGRHELGALVMFLSGTALWVVGMLLRAMGRGLRTPRTPVPAPARGPAAALTASDHFRRWLAARGCDWRTVGDKELLRLVYAELDARH